MFSDQNTQTTVVVQEPQPLMITVISKARVKLAGSQLPELVVMLSYLHALRTMHQVAHWTTTGQSSYSDHLLFERLYNNANSEADDLAEKLVGLDSPSALDAFQLSLNAAVIMKQICRQLPITNGDALALRALQAELDFLQGVKIVASSLESEGKLSIGLDNLLGDICDTHEEHVYLLKQRLNRVG